MDLNSLSSVVTAGMSSERVSAAVDACMRALEAEWIAGQTPLAMALDELGAALTDKADPGLKKLDPLTRMAVGGFVHQLVKRKDKARAEAAAEATTEGAADR